MPVTSIDGGKAVGAGEESDRENAGITSLPDCGHTTPLTNQRQSERKTLKTRWSRANLVDAMFGAACRFLPLLVNGERIEINVGGVL